MSLKYVWEIWHTTDKLLISFVLCSTLTDNGITRDGFMDCNVCEQNKTNCKYEYLLHYSTYKTLDIGIK